MRTKPNDGCGVCVRPRETERERGEGEGGRETDEGIVEFAPQRKSSSARRFVLMRRFGGK